MDAETRGRRCQIRVRRNSSRRDGARQDLRDDRSAHQRPCADQDAAHRAARPTATVDRGTRQVSGSAPDSSDRCQVSRGRRVVGTNMLGRADNVRTSTPQRGEAQHRNV